MMLGAKGILPPLIPNCYVLCTLAILKTFVIRSFFFKKWLLTHINYTITHMKKKVLEEANLLYPSLGFSTITFGSNKIPLLL